MSVELHFFCGAKDEVALLDFLLSSGDVVPIPTYPLYADVLPVVNVDRRPAWPAKWSIYLWLRSAGKIRWLRSHLKKGEPRPPLPRDELVSPEVRRLMEPPPGKAFVDNLGCPVIEYDRGMRQQGHIGQASLHVAVENMRQEVGEDQPGGAVILQTAPKAASFFFFGEGVGPDQIVQRRLGLAFGLSSAPAQQPAKHAALPETDSSISELGPNNRDPATRPADACRPRP